MPYKLSWYVPGRIILVDCEGTIATDEIREFAQRGNEMVASGRPLVHFMVDFRRLEKIESVPQAVRTLQQNPPHRDMGWVILLGTLNPVLTMFGDMAAMVLRLRYRRAETLEEGLAFLRERDASLPR